VRPASRRAVPAAAARMIAAKLAAATLAGCGASPLAEQSELPEWRLVPAQRIGDESDPGAALNRIHGLVIGPAGEVLVTQSRVPAVTVFDRSGRYRGTIGRAGQGPGEFVVPGPLGWRGDTLWVADPQGGRIELFTAAGRPLESIRFTVPPTNAGDLAGGPTHLLADGAVLAGGSITASSTVLHGLVRTTRHGDVIDTIARLPVPPGYISIVELDPRRRMSLIHPLPSVPLWALSSGADRIVVVDRTPAAGRGTANIRLTLIGLGGDTITVAERAYTPVEVTAAWADRWFGDFADTMATYIPETAAALERLLRASIELPRFHPPVTALASGADGTFWLRREDADGAVVRWEVVDSAGRWLAWLDAPRELAIVRADRSEVWGALTDALDVPTLIRFRVN
jgi:hypothetical protein